MTLTAIVRRATILAAYALIGSVAHAQGYRFFPNDAAINYSIPFSSNVVVGYQDGTFGAFIGASSPTVGLVGGGSVGSLSIYNSSTLNVSGGSSSGLVALNNSTINFSSGTNATGITALDNSTVNITGGTPRNLISYTNSIINASAGRIDDLTLYDNTTINLFGTGLSATLVDSNYAFMFNEYLLSGRLTDGTYLSNYHLDIQHGSNVKVNFILTSKVIPAAGQIAFDGITAPVTLTFEFRTPGTSPYNPVNPTPPLFTTAVTLKADTTSTHSYTLPIIPPGTYDIAIKSSTSLRKVLKNVVIAGTTGTIPQATVFGGDATGDNTITFDDFLVLLNAFGTTYDPTDTGNGYDAAADFNYDANVNFDDFLILLNNYGTTGDL